MSDEPTDCIFCQIVAGDIPAARIYEDDDVLAFLDIRPVSKGHALLMPKAHWRDIFDAPPEALATVAQRIPLVAKAVQKAVNAEGLNIYQNNAPAAGQVVFHLHYHIIPRHAGDDAFGPWSHVNYDEGEAQRIAERIAEHIEP